MRAAIRSVVVSLALIFGMMSISTFWTVPVWAGSQQGDQEKKKSKGKGDRSTKDQKPNAGGPHGEEETGGAGPSGPAPLPPGQAPGFEGANKDKSKGPTSGGPR